MALVLDFVKNTLRSLVRWDTPIHYRPYEHFFMRLGLVSAVYASFASSACKGTTEEMLSLRPNGIQLFVDLSRVCHPTLRLFWNPLFLLASFIHVFSFRGCNFFSYRKTFSYLSLMLITMMDLTFFTMKNSKGWIGHSNQICSIILLTQFFYFSFAYLRNFLLFSKICKDICPAWLVELLIPYQDWSPIINGEAGIVGDDSSLSTSPPPSPLSTSTSPNSTTASSSVSVTMSSSTASSVASSSSSSISSTSPSSDIIPPHTPIQLNLPHYLTEEDMAVFYSQQAIVCTYVMAAITKYQKSTGEWMAETQNIVIQVIKANQMNFFNFLKPNAQENAFAGLILGFCIASPFLAQLVFGGGLYLEFFAFLALFNRTTLLLGGISLWALHQGILVMMRLEFYKNQKMLSSYFINLPYWLVLALVSFSNYIATTPSTVSGTGKVWKPFNSKLRSFLFAITSDDPITGLWALLRRSPFSQQNNLSKSFHSSGFDVENQSTASWGSMAFRRSNGSIKHATSNSPTFSPFSSSSPLSSHPFSAVVGHGAGGHYATASPVRFRRYFSSGRSGVGVAIVRVSRKLIHKVPWKFMIFLTVVCYNMQEWYPFSHFPMYASNSEETDFLFVTDKADRALPFTSYFAARTTSLRKYFRYIRRGCLNEFDAAVEREKQQISTTTTTTTTPPPRLTKPQAIDNCTLVAAGVTLRHFYEQSQAINAKRAADIRQYMVPLKLYMRSVHMWPNGTITSDDFLVAVHPLPYSASASSASGSLETFVPSTLQAEKNGKMEVEPGFTPSMTKPRKSSVYSLAEMLVDTAPPGQEVIDVSLQVTEEAGSGQSSTTAETE